MSTALVSVDRAQVPVRPRRQKRAEASWRPATYPTRVFAAVMSLGIYVGIACVALATLAELRPSVVAEHSTQRAVVAALLVVLASIIVAVLATSGDSPSPGQALCGLRVISVRDGAPASPIRCLPRNALAVVLQTAFGLAALSPLWHPRRRAWHDRLTGTAVAMTGGPIFGVLAPVLCCVIAAVGGTVLIAALSR